MGKHPVYVIWLDHTFDCLFGPWVGKIPWRRERLPTPVFWPREFHGLYSPWGCKESDTTEQLSLHFTSLGPTQDESDGMERDTGYQGELHEHVDNMWDMEGRGKDDVPN